ncbi:putative pectinesterase 29 [Sesamum alatum]|uniref:Pectinesterase n=1 Tax=Sesamum alatum TaxID=300844 RepID=A0AAE1Y0R4_9LAMI|nr:putative pectinesterase 29 [Sesamum alatum]
MLCYQVHAFIFLSFFIAFPSTNATFPTIYVNPSGEGNFTTIQAAIDSVPAYNKRWTCIHIERGLYREQIRIPYDKPFIYLRGQGERKTYVVWDAHDSTSTSATFTSQADNTIAKYITFINSYNSHPISKNKPMRPAVAAMIQGDKSVFHRCGFFGLQDTLWDEHGRHYFRSCSIKGAVDFIFGAGQSLYEGCTISVVARALKGPGYITAQGRSHAQDTNGFVFKNCNIGGNGKTFLGRPWRDYARVVFYNTSMSSVVVPQGWDARVGLEDRPTFAEHNCRGVGSNTSRRVKWLKKLSERDLNYLTSISFIDDDGWMNKLPFNL